MRHYPWKYIPREYIRILTLGEKMLLGLTPSQACPSPFAHKEKRGILGLSGWKRRIVRATQRVTVKWYGQAFARVERHNSLAAVGGCSPYARRFTRGRVPPSTRGLPLVASWLHALLIPLVVLLTCTNLLRSQGDREAMAFSRPMRFERQSDWCRKGNIWISFLANSGTITERGTQSFIAPN